MHTYIHSNKNPYKQNYSSSPFLSARLSFLLASPFCSNSSSVVCISKIPSYSVRQNTIGSSSHGENFGMSWANSNARRISLLPRNAWTIFSNTSSPFKKLMKVKSNSWVDIPFEVNRKRHLYLVWSVMKRRVVVVDLGMRGWNQCLVSLPKDYLFNIVCPFFPWWVARRDLTTSENWR